jgi:hypothetical protein
LYPLIVVQNQILVVVPSIFVIAQVLETILLLLLMLSRDFGSRSTTNIELLMYYMAGCLVVGIDPDKQTIPS